MPAATVQPSPPAVAKLRRPVAPLLQNSQHFGKPPFIGPKPIPPLLSLGNNCDLNSVRHTCCPSFSKIPSNSVNNPSQCQNPYSFNLAKNAITIRPGTILTQSSVWLTTLASSYLVQVPRIHQLPKGNLFAHYDQRHWSKTSNSEAHDALAVSGVAYTLGNFGRLHCLCLYRLSGVQRYYARLLQLQAPQERHHRAYYGSSQPPIVDEE